MSAEEFKVIGKSVPRVDAFAKVTGRAEFIRDLNIPGMLRTKILRSPHAHAHIAKIDTSRAEGLPGVAAVLTHKNIPTGWPAFGQGKPHIRILDEKVRFVGDPVAVVAAESEEIAEEASGLIEVEYEPLPAVLTIDEAMKSDGPRLHDEFGDNFVPETSTVTITGGYGDVEAGFREADVIVEGSPDLRNILPAIVCLEPEGAVAWWEGDKVAAIVSTQHTPRVAEHISDCTGLPVSSIRTTSVYIGGDGSSKSNAMKHVEFAVALSRITDRPVGCFFNKQEQFLRYRRGRLKVHYKIGLKKDGKVTALETDLIGDVGAYCYVGWIFISAATTYPPAVFANFPNYRVRRRAVVTNTPPAGGCRGYGYLVAHWSLAQVMMKAVEKIGMDPYEVFMKNAVGFGDTYHGFRGAPQICENEPIKKAAEEAARRFAWKDKWRGWGKPTAIDGTKIRAVGVGWGGHIGAGRHTFTATVALSENGRITMTPGIGAYGSGQRENVRKFAAEVLKVPYDIIKSPPADTDANPFYSWCRNNCGTYALGNAVLHAAEDARQKLLELAAPKLGVEPHDLETEDRVIYVKGKPEQKIHWDQILGGGLSVIGVGNHTGSFTVPTILAGFAEIELDTETGQFEVANYVVATDVGRIVSPLDCAQQLVFALVQDGTREAYIIDDSTGRILNTNYTELESCTFAELPPFQTVITETPAPGGPFGASGIGEPAGVPLPQAVVMALYNATGKIIELPATPDKILEALGKI